MPSQAFRVNKHLMKEREQVWQVLFKLLEEMDPKDGRLNKDCTNIQRLEFKYRIVNNFPTNNKRLKPKQSGRIKSKEINGKEKNKRKLDATTKHKFRNKKSTVCEGKVSIITRSMKNKNINGEDKKEKTATENTLNQNNKKKNNISATVKNGENRKSDMETNSIINRKCTNIKSNVGKGSQLLKNMENEEVQKTLDINSEIVYEFKNMYFNTYNINQELLQRVESYNPEIYGLVTKHLMAMELNNFDFMKLTKISLNRALKYFKGDLQELEMYIKYHTFLFDVLKSMENEEVKKTLDMNSEIVCEFKNMYFNTYNINQELLQRVESYNPEIHGLVMKHLMAMELNNFDFMKLAKISLDRGVKHFKGDLQELEMYIKYHIFLFDVCNSVNNYV